MNVPADPQQQESQIFLGRQPILNRNQDLVAYELLFRSGQQNFASFTDGVQATATVIVNAFTEMSLGEVLGHCRGFINVDENFLLSDVLELLPPQSVVLEILETVVPTPEVVARCRELKALGFTLALDDVIQLGPEYDELLELVSIIKVDLQPLSVPALEALVRQAKPLKKFLLAEKVDSQEQMQHCLDLGFDLFQGYYFAKPTVMTGKRLSPSHLSLMKLLGLVLADAEIHRLESAFKPEPGLTMNMLRLANSVGMGLTSRITSLKHALIVMGQRQLQRWLQLLLFAAGKTETGRNPLLQLAATRGRFMELLAQAVMPGVQRFADQAFMVGILSLMPVLVNQSIEEVLAPLGLTQEVMQALCTSEGQLAQLLKIVIADEQNEPEKIMLALAQLPRLDLSTVSRCLAQALAWANSIEEEAQR